MEVVLRQWSDLDYAEECARTCTATVDKCGTVPRFLINKIVATGHHSVLEHVFLSFEIAEVSRALLQEVARHRISSLSVQSTRYALKKLLKGEISPVYPPEASGAEIALIDSVFEFAIQKLEEAQILGVRNDVLKYLIPECFPTEFRWSINLRSFINMYKLRTDRSALPEFQELANRMFDLLPKGHQSIVTEAVS